MTDTHRYDAIVVGGGHNGLVNGAYLAKAGMKTLILEQRHLVGGAAITEELYPGFSFTTFSYALSLIRPEVIRELELVKHGFNPIYMPTSFAPMENGDYLLPRPGPRREHPRDHAALDAGRRRDGPLRARRRAHPAADVPALRPHAPRHLRQDSRGRRGRRLAARSPRVGGAEGHPRRGPPDHRQHLRLPRRLLRERDPQGLPRGVLDDRHQGRPDVRRVRSRLADDDDG